MTMMMMKRRMIEAMRARWILILIAAMLCAIGTAIALSRQGARPRWLAELLLVESAGDRHLARHDLFIDIAARDDYPDQILRELPTMSAEEKGILARYLHELCKIEPYPSLIDVGVELQKLSPTNSIELLDVYGDYQLHAVALALLNVIENESVDVATRGAACDMVAGKVESGESIPEELRDNYKDVAQRIAYDDRVLPLLRIQALIVLAALDMDDEVATVDLAKNIIAQMTDAARSDAEPWYEWLHSLLAK